MPPTGLPIIGRVAAGTPILATENIEGYLEIDRVLEDRSTLFALQVKGDSMVDRQVHEGDYVIVRTQPWIEHGDIGVIAIDEEITVKTVLHRRTGLWLKPENQQQGYPLIRLRPEQRVRVVGKVIAIFGRFGLSWGAAQRVVRHSPQVPSARGLAGDVPEKD